MKKGRGGFLLSGGMILIRARCVVLVCHVVFCFFLSHTACPKKYKAEVEALFPGVKTDNLLVVPTCQHAKMDLVQTGDNVEQEKDYCLEKVRRHTHT